MALGDITVGKAPGNTQVDLAQMRGGLNSVLAPGMLGNTRINPMSSVIAAGGDAGMQYQNAIANQRMQQMGLQAKEQALQQAMQQYEMQQQKPGLTDILGTGLSAFSLGSGLSSGGNKMPKNFGMTGMDQLYMDPNYLNMVGPPNAGG